MKKQGELLQSNKRRFPGGRLLTMALMVMALVCVMTTVVGAADVGDDTALIAAINSATAGDTITLTADITVTEALEIDKNLTINVYLYDLEVTDFTVTSDVTFTSTGYSSGNDWGTMSILGNATIYGTFDNGCTVYLGSETNDDATMTIDESGIYSVTDELINYGTLTNKGTFDAGGWGTYNYGEIYNTGIFTNNYTFENYDTIENTGKFISYKMFNNNSGSTFDNSNGTLTNLYTSSSAQIGATDEYENSPNPAGFYVKEGASFDNENGTVNNYGKFFNGTTTDSSAKFNNTNGYFENFAVYDDEKEMVVVSYLYNYGTIDNTDGTMVNGIYIASASSTGSSSQSASFDNMGTIKNGTIFDETSYVIGGTLTNVTEYECAYVENTDAGTEDDPYEIDNAAELYFFLTQDCGVYGQLTDDIDYDTYTYGAMGIIGEKDLNLATYEISVVDQTTATDYPFMVMSESSFTMHDGSITIGENVKGTITTEEYGTNMTLTIENMTITHDSEYLGISGYGDLDMTIRGCTFYANTGGAIYTYGEDVVTSIYDCTVYQIGYIDSSSVYRSVAVATAGMGETTIYSGTYDCDTYGVMVFSSGGPLIIKGGDFSAGTAVLRVDGGSTGNGYPNGVGDITVYGGTFDGKIVVNTPLTATITIMGGTFSNTGLEKTAFEAYVPTGYEVTENPTGTYTVAVTEADKVATVTDSDGNVTGYASLAVAVAAATSGDTVTILKDLGTINITIDKGLTIIGVEDEDGNYPEIHDNTQDNAAFEVQTNEQVIFENLHFMVDNRAIAVYHDGHVADTAASTTTNWTGTANDRLNANIIVRNCVIEEDDLSGSDIAGALISAGEGSEELGYTLVVDNCEFIGTFDKAILISLDANDSFTFTNNTLEDENDASTTDGFTVIPLSGTPEITITGNTFTNYTRVVLADHADVTANWTITGNILINTDYILNYDSRTGFNNDISVAYNYNRTTEDATGTVVGLLDEATPDNTSKIITYPYYTDAAMTELYYGVASVTSGDEITYFGTLAAAVAYAADGDTVTLLENVEITTSITIDENITIVGATGEEKIHISTSNKYFVLSSNVKVVFTELKFDVDYSIIKTASSIATNASITFDDCEFDIGGTNSSYIVYGSTGSTTDVTIKNSFIGGDIRKAVLVYLSGDSVFTFTGNEVTDEAPNVNGSAMTVVMESDTAKAVITGNTFTDLYRGFCVDNSTASGSWTITGNSFVNVGAVLDLSSTVEYNKNFNLAYNYFGGSLPVIMDSGAENADYNESATISGNDKLKLTDAGIEYMNLTLYPYYSDAALTTLVYEDVGEVTVEEAASSALETATSESATAEDITTAVTLVTLADSETLASDDTLLEMVNTLDTSLIAAINADDSTGTLDTDVAITTLSDEEANTAADAVDGVDKEDLQVNTSAATEVVGLALAVVGNDTIENKTTVTVTLEIAQTAATVSADEEGTISATVTYDIYPTMTVTDDDRDDAVISSGTVSNDDINAPISFKLFLPSIFDDTNRATVVHKDGETIYSTTTYVVYHDGTDNYIWITTTHFSEFEVSLAANVSTSSGGTSYYSSSVASTSNGDVSISSSKSKMNSTVTITTDPDDGYEVGTVTVAYSSGKEVSVTDNGDGTYSYLQPGAAVTVTVTFVATGEEIETETLFDDVDEDAYYYDAVLWAVENGITAGYADGTFRPTDSCTRAQAVTFLWRAAGEPEATIANPFSDLDETAYYYDAVLWAVENNITTGYDDGTFRPDTTCNRGAIVTFLYRLAGEPEVSGETLSDVADGAYYYDAVLWAVENGITTGYDDGTFRPTTTCNRGAIVTFLYRYLGE